ncbi:MAG TPA: hypothetical protein VGI00_18265, partial [Streptosporangiaceae bacterium]
TLPGALWGALVLVLVPTYLTNVGTSHGLSSGASSSVPIAAYGLILIVVMLVFPAGIQGGIRRLFGSASAGPPHRDAVASGSTAPRRRIPFTPLRRSAQGRENQEEGPS